MDKLIPILWHMHQPCYKDPKGEYIMPWVFLHAIKDYYDMPYFAVKHNVRVTFNLVPSLIVQLKDYSNFDVNDRFLKFIKKKERSEYEKGFILDIVKSISFALSNKFPRFKELLKKPYLDMNDMNDIEVFFLLSHCGNYLTNHSKVVKDLINKSSFSWEDKIQLLEELHRFVSKILPFYKKAYLNGLIELSVSPFYHPILPLLIDINDAGNLRKPNFYVSFKDDARLQIERSIELFVEEFGRKPAGMWPSEGSVSKKTLDLINDFGFRWIATDEDILHKTNPSYDLENKYIYKNTIVIFRNKTISDKIGFTYRFLGVDDAIADLRNLFGRVNVIIMDGENAWEYYQDPWGFLDAFYEEVSKHKPMTMSEFADCEKLETIELEGIASGSWIGASFHIWMGDEEKNKAWAILSKAKTVIDNEYNEKAHKLLLIDEGSDWFWWYGQTCYTKHKKLYDYLFKSRIGEIYKILNKSADEILSFVVEDREFNRPPISYIEPQINGRETFFEYVNAGYVERKSSAIHERRNIKWIKYGYDKINNLYLAIGLRRFKGYQLRINNKIYELKRGIHGDYAVDKIVEIKLPFCDNIVVELLRNGVVVEVVSFEVKPINFTWIV